MTAIFKLTLMFAFMMTATAAVAESDRVTSETEIRIPMKYLATALASSTCVDGADRYGRAVTTLTGFTEVVRVLRGESSTEQMETNADVLTEGRPDTCAEFKKLISQSDVLIAEQKFTERVSPPNMLDLCSKFIVEQLLVKDSKKIEILFAQSTYFTTASPSKANCRAK